MLDLKNSTAYYGTGLTTGAGTGTDSCGSDAALSSVGYRLTTSLAGASSDILDFVKLKTY